ncbi:SMI1/KNR4 family protein [Tenacibaculum discolor]|uniref:SMI1/KNR4 family protein n=1 Tax=Tenacibaculum discolor TaxID=361581 RepID=UPI000F592CEC
MNKTQTYFYFGRIRGYSDSIYQKDLVKNILHSAKRLPFATDGSGQYLCIDYDPAEKGTYGQIIYLTCAEPEPVSVIADSFDDFVDFLIEEYKNDRFYIDDERTEWGEEEWTEWRQDQQSDYSKVEIIFGHTRRNDWTDIADKYNKKKGIVSN